MVKKKTKIKKTKTKNKTMYEEVMIVEDDLFDRCVRKVWITGHCTSGSARTHPSQPAFGGTQQDVICHHPNCDAEAGESLRTSRIGRRQSIHEIDSPQ